MKEALIQKLTEKVKSTVKEQDFWLEDDAADDWCGNVESCKSWNYPSSSFVDERIWDTMEIDLRMYPKVFSAVCDEVFNAWDELRFKIIGR